MTPVLRSGTPGDIAGRAGPVARGRGGRDRVPTTPTRAGSWCSSTPGPSSWPLTGPPSWGRSSAGWDGWRGSVYRLGGGDRPSPPRSRPAPAGVCRGPVRGRGRPARRRRWWWKTTNGPPGSGGRARGRSRPGASASSDEPRPASERNLRRMDANAKTTDTATPPISEVRIAPGVRGRARRVPGQLRRRERGRRGLRRLPPGQEGGRPVGWASPTGTTGRPWDEDTMVLVYSTTKGVTAMCANRLAQEGRLDVDAPVVTYWPEFAQAGKATVTVADLLAHRAGLAWVDGTMTFEEMLRWDPVVDALARQAPSWPPGTAHGYHATTYGWLVGEVVRRITGKSIGTYLRNEIAGPLGAEFFIGLPADKEPRVARLVSFLDSLDSGGDSPALAPGTRHGAGCGRDGRDGGYLPGPDGPLPKALARPGGALQRPGDMAQPPRCTRPRSRRPTASATPAPWPVCTAPAWMRWQRRRATSFRILEPEQLDRAVQQQTQGPDAVLMGLDLQWGLGIQGQHRADRARRPGRAPFLRSLRHGRLGGMGRPRPPPGHGIRHEQDGDRARRVTPAASGSCRRASTPPRPRGRDMKAAVYYETGGRPTSCATRTSPTLCPVPASCWSGWRPSASRAGTP